MRGLLVLMLLICGNSFASEDMTKEFEGFRSHSYIDTVGVKTIGYGFNMKACNITKDTITREEADKLFTARYKQAKQEAIDYIGETAYARLNTLQRSIIVDMSYNLGYRRLSQFKKLKQAIINGDYELASLEMKNSKWYYQTGRRAKHHVENFRRG